MGTYNEVKKVLIEHFHVDDERVKPDSKLIEDLGADSLDSVEIVLVLEDKFNIDISNEETRSVNTVSDIVAIVENKIKAKK